MIVPMVKVYVAARSQDRQALLETIRPDLGEIHLVPADPDAGSGGRTDGRADPDLATRPPGAVRNRASRRPSGTRPPLEAAREVLHIERQNVEHGNRLAALHHEIEQLDLWGNVRLQQIEDLRQAGIDVQFYARAGSRRDCRLPRSVWPWSENCPTAEPPWPRRRRGGKVQLPESAVPLPLPPRDAPSIRAEAAQIDARPESRTSAAGRTGSSGPSDARRAGTAASSRPSLCGLSAAGVASDQLFAVQGWLPAEQAPSLPQTLARKESACGGAVERADRRRTAADA